MNTKISFKRFKGLTLCLTIALILSLAACSAGTTQTTDSGFINNNDQYEDTKYWESKDLNIVTNVFLTAEEVDDDFEAQSFSKLSKKQTKKVNKLKKAIYNYFVKNYNIDFSRELEQQKVTFFSAPSIANSITMGYVDIKDSNTLHLNEALNSDYQDLFESTYVHETLHQLGFQDETCKATYIIEGIVDAYTDLILTSNNANSQPTELYFETRQLGYQMIAADTNLPNVFINKESLKDYINNSLVSYNQEYVQHNDLAEYLNTLLESLIAIRSGTGYSENAYYYAFDAQAIVQKFCQEHCQANKSTIEYIRHHYLLENFEDLNIVDYGDGSYSIN